MKHAMSDKSGFIGIIMDLIIRKANEKDIDDFQKLLSDQRVMAFIEPPFSKEKTCEFLAKAGLTEPPLIYVAEDDSRFIGYVIYHDYDDKSVEIGWVLLPEYWGKGYASILTEKLIEKAFLSNKEVVIECAPGQEISKRIAYKHQFKYEGQFDGLDVFRLKPSIPVDL